jgi:hypothetical protein
MLAAVTALVELATVTAARDAELAVSAACAAVRPIACDVHPGEPRSRFC